MHGTVINSLFLFRVPVHSSIPNSLSLLMIFFLPSPEGQKDPTALEKDRIWGKLFCGLVLFPPLRHFAFSVTARIKGKRSL